MEYLVFKVAELRIRIMSDNIGILKSIEEMYKNYISKSGENDYSIKVDVQSMDDLIDYSKVSHTYNQGRITNLVYTGSFDPDKREAHLITSTNNAYFVIEQYMLIFLNQILFEHNMVLFHSASICDNENNAYLFYGPSCIGKSTISRNTKLRVISDDLVILKHIEGNNFELHKTPFTRDKSVDDNVGVYKVKGFFRLKQSETEFIEEMTEIESFTTFMGNIWDINKAYVNEKYLGLIKLITTQVPGFYLHFTRDSIVENIIEKK
jgi:hypothetical protein